MAPPAGVSQASVTETGATERFLTLNSQDGSVHSCRSSYAHFRFCTRPHDNQRLLTDQEIIRGFLAGSKRDYAVVLGWITAVVRSRLWSDRVAGDDVIADTRLKLLMNFRENSFRVESSLKTHVQRITLYTLVDAARRQKRLVPLTDENNQAETSDPLSQLQHDEEIDLLERAMAMLPDGCQDLFYKTLYKKMKCRDVAAREGTTEGAIKTRLSRCRDKLSQIMREIS